MSESEQIERTLRSRATTERPLPSRMITALASTLGEAWTELRTHRLRVILSLIGIAVAVAALTAVVALGELQKQAMLENNERWGGRIATLRIDTMTTDGSPVDWKHWRHPSSFRVRSGSTLVARRSHRTRSSP